MLRLVSAIGSLANTRLFELRFTNENMGLRLRTGGDGNCGTGEDGGLDPGTLSEEASAVTRGLDDNSRTANRGGDGAFSVSSSSPAAPRSLKATHLRFVGGGCASWTPGAGLRWREYVLMAFLVHR